MSDHPSISEPATPLRDIFHERLDALEDLVTEAALLVSDALPRVNDGYLAGDLAVQEECRRLCARVQGLVERAEDDGFVLIAREGPVSGDLRRIVAVLRLVHDIDRTANLMRHVPETLSLLDPRTLPDGIAATVRTLATESAAVFAGGVDAYRRRDALALRDVDDRDRIVDDTARALVDIDGGVDANAHMALGLIARYYERIADHGVAFARDTAFIVTGERAPQRPRG